MNITYQRSFSAAKEPDAPLRQKAYKLAKIYAVNEDRHYPPPLIKAAKAYLEAIDRDIPETDKYAFAKALQREVEEYTTSVESQLRMLNQHSKVFFDVYQDHERMTEEE